MGFDAQAPPFLVNGRPPTDRDAFAREVFDRLVEVLEEKKKKCDGLAEQYADVGYPRFENVERDFLLQILDAQWKDHLHTMDGLREGIGLRGYASRDPKLEYQREGYALFEEMNARIDSQVLEIAYKVQLRDPGDTPVPARPPPAPAGPAEGPLADPGRRALSRQGASGRQPGKQGKVGRNDPCPCGSGKKYKKCHGA